MVAVVDVCSTCLEMWTPKLNGWHIFLLSSIVGVVSMKPHYTHTHTLYILYTESGNMQISNEFQGNANKRSSNQYLSFILFIEIYT